jgi:hypothetical protein
MFCLALAGLLSPPVFLCVLLVHLGVALFRFDTEIAGTFTALAAVAAVICLDGWRVFTAGSQALLSGVRDLVVVMAMARLLMRKSTREMLQIAALALSEAMFATILTRSPAFLVGLALMLLLLPMTLDALDGRDHPHPQRAGVRGTAHWAGVYAGIVLSSCILFYLLPRPASSMISHSLAREKRHVFSESVDLSAPVKGPNDHDVVMRVVWDSPRRPGAFYLAGSRLEAVTPEGFTRDEGARSTPEGRALEGARSTDHLIVYQTGLDAACVFYPFTLCAVRPSRIRAEGCNLCWRRETPLRYELWVVRSPSTLAPRLQALDYGGKEDVAAIARDTAGDGSAQARVGRLVEYLGATCSYAASPPAAPRGENAVEWFLFTAKTGNCEHYAAALATMIRCIGIPARVVSGFLVKEFNEGGGYYIVRASDAHAWVEYFDGAWRLADATPAEPMAPAATHHMLDRLRFLWIRWVIDYSLDDQIRLAVRAFSGAGRMGQDLLRMWQAALSASIASVAAFVLLHAMAGLRRRPLYGRVLRALVKKGIKLDGNLPHERHLQEVERYDRDLAASFEAFLDGYLRWRFKGADVDIRALTRDMERKIREHRITSRRSAS